jgi:hypothetical protein
MYKIFLRLFLVFAKWYKFKFNVPNLKEFLTLNTKLNIRCKHA